jgi:hypothetical protein
MLKGDGGKAQLVPPGMDSAVVMRTFGRRSRVSAAQSCVWEKAGAAIRKGIAKAARRQMNRIIFPSIDCREY